MEINQTTLNNDTEKRQHHNHFHWNLIDDHYVVKFNPLVCVCQNNTKLETSMSNRDVRTNDDPPNSIPQANFCRLNINSELLLALLLT